MDSWQSTDTSGKLILSLGLGLGLGLASNCLFLYNVVILFHAEWCIR